MTRANRTSRIANEEWLPDMDLNHDKQIQSLLCYRYTIGQAGAFGRLTASRQESRFVESLDRWIVEPDGRRGAAVGALQRLNDSAIQRN
jgi:hypothetical protein